MSKWKTVVFAVVLSLAGLLSVYFTSSDPEEVGAEEELMIFFEEEELREELLGEGVYVEEIVRAAPGFYRVYGEFEVYLVEVAKTGSGHTYTIYHEGETVTKFDD
ncbi:hypothetical protein CR205_10465 [Alteribacter lacisalsi]|uniref:Uncharacterized protein n=1 Tax=Alteribacter lacisalsi TaxID=2045244 RepID=A0A2W0HN17_9BACI|nr:hypothetical protein [Alteribacter lacisalsi]PYZ98965.1 hypothetical protein CR205_10465 [Alteribacter lacisalsi]